MPTGGKPRSVSHSGLADKIGGVSVPGPESPLVDVIVATHSTSRPVARAVGSVLAHTRAPVRVTVVAHNIDIEVVRAALGDWAADPRLRLVGLRDGIPSPAGPFNHGMDLATAPFSAVLGSDDEFEPGALDAWLELQRRSGAAFVIARNYHVHANAGHPPVRPGRMRGLDAVRDRLSYRSAPLGLLSRDRFGDLRFTVGLASGEDIAFVSRMWFSGHPIAYARTAPAYFGHDDAGDRVTMAPRPVEVDFAFLDEILGTPWFTALRPAARQAFVVKVLRVHLIDAIAARLGSAWTPETVDALGAMIRRVLEAAPRSTRLLSSVDHRIVDAILQADTGAAPDPDAMADLIARRQRYRTIPAVVTRNPLFALHPQAPFRALAAGLIVIRSRPRTSLLDPPA